MIELKHINKTYDKKVSVLNDINLTLPDVGLISIVGESGSGKTTLLHILGGLDKYDGEVFYNGVKYNSHQLDIYRQDGIGIIFQNYLLFENLTVYDNLAICLKIIGITDKEEVDKRITYVLNQVGMFKMRKKLAKNLSGGQQQRISIARALIKETKVLLADEPTGNLDRKNTIEIMNILKKISKTTLVVLVTHNKEMANLYSDSIVGIVDGKISDNQLDVSTHHLKDYQDDIIYLEDFSKNTIDANQISLEIYGDNTPINLKLIFKDGRIFIASDKELNVININNVKEEREEFDFDKMSHTDYDSSWYNNVKKRQSIVNFKQALINFFKPNSLKFKVYNFFFFMLGIILAICIANFYSAIYIDKSDFIYLDNSYSIYSNKEDTFKKFSNYDSIPGVTKYTNYLTGTVQDYDRNGTYNIVTNREAYETNLAFMSDLEENELLAGNRDDLVISKGLAQIMYPKLEWNEIIGKTINIAASGYAYTGVISGIASESGKEIFVIDRIISNFITKSNSVVATYYYNILPIEDYTYEEVESVYPDTDLIPCYILEGSKFTLGTYVGERMIATKIIQVEDLDPLYNLATVFVDRQYVSLLNKARDYLDKNGVYLKSVVDYKIVEGTDITDENSCLAPVNSGYRVGQSVKVSGSRNYWKVSGLYASNYEDSFNRILIDKTCLILSYCFNVDLGFETEDILAVEQYLAEKHPSYYAEKIYDFEYDEMMEINRNDIMIYGLVSAILIAIYVVFIYFIMRSKVLSEQYDIAVYRCLGAKKDLFIKKYIIDIFVLTIFTSLIGYAITYLVINILNKLALMMVGEILIPIYGLSVLLGLGIMVIINFVIGIIPILLNLRRSPASLIAKYDM